MPQYLNRSARPNEIRARNRVENWFGKIPHDAQKDIRGRARSGKASQYLAAFFEILIHELLMRLGCSIAVHPTTTTTKRPDFLAANQGARFYVECTTMDPDADSLIPNVYERDIVSKINNNLFSPDYRIEGASIGKLTRYLSKKMMLPKIEKLISGDVPFVKMIIPSAGSNGDWIGCLWLRKVSWPVKEGVVPKIFPLGFGRGGTINAAKRLKKVLSDKASIYGELEHPYIIAVHVVNVQPDDEHSALGDLWLHHGNPLNTGVKAVWVLRGMYPWSLHRGSACLYISPWIKIEEIPVILRQFSHAEVRPGELTAHYIPGKSVADIIGCKPSE